MTDVAAALDTDFKVIKELNPQIFGYYLPKGRYRLRVPSGQGFRVPYVLKQLTFVALQGIETDPKRRYVVQGGDTLNAISQRTGVSVNALRRVNGIQGSLITVGQTLALNP